jgi:hypothetical protein
MIDLEQEIQIKWNVSNRGWYIAKGFTYTKCTDIFTVKAKDLPRMAKAKIKVICDFCNCTVIKVFANYNKAIEKHSGHLAGDCCSACRGIKVSVANKTSFSKVKKAFDNLGLVLQTDKYTHSSEPMPCICNNHKDRGVQYIAYGELYGRKHGCVFCFKESRNVKEFIRVETDKYLITKHTKVRWSNLNKEHYENLGYSFTKNGNYFIIKTSDLTIGSPVIVECKCSKCDSINTIEYRKLVLNVQRNGHYKCGGCLKYTQEEIETMFADVGYEVISEYKGVDTPIRYKCHKHGKQKVFLGNFLSGNRCRKCSDEARMVEYELVEKAFVDMGYELLTKEYGGNKQLLQYRCEKHPDEISEIKYNDIQQGHGCPYCKNDATSERQSGSGSWNWKGGISSLNQYLRSCLNGWKLDSMKACNFKCVITGGKFDAVHHLTSFAHITQEMLVELNMDVREQVSMYTDDELEMMSNRLVAKHYEYGLGICLCSDMHKLFHKLYGKETVRPWHFDEFKVRLEAGEFD